MNSASRPRGGNEAPSLSSLCEAVGGLSPLPLLAVQGERHLVRYANPAFCRLFGKRREEIVGRPFSEVAPDDDQCLGLLDRVRRTETAEMIVGQEREANRCAFWSYSAWPVKMSDGRVAGIAVEVAETKEFHRKTVAMNESLMLANVRQHELTEAAEELNMRLLAEVSERKQVEAALRASENRLQELSRSLEQRVEERTRELQEQAARLRRLATELVSAEQRERKHLAALLHDDLQQLLVAAKMDLDMVKKRLREGDDLQSIERATHWIDEATRAARELTSQLRPPALYEQGFVAALHWLASHTWDRYRVRVTITGEEPSKPVSDEFNALLFDCVRELLLNIVKHAKVDEASIAVEEVNDCLQVRVRDEGRGFDMEATEHGQTGSGFGLFSMRERLVALGGQISIVSARDRGTCIQLEIPLSLAADEGPRPPISGRTVSSISLRKDQKAVAAKHQVRVLVVDDHAMIRQGLATIIDEDERMNVVGEAGNGVEAIQAIEAMEENRPDIILIDVNMPHMNGIEATREIHRRWPDPIIIGLSVQDDETTANLMRRAGAGAFLSKGGSAERLISTILELHSDEGGAKARV